MVGMTVPSIPKNVHHLQRHYSALLLLVVLLLLAVPSKPINAYRFDILGCLLSRCKFYYSQLALVKLHKVVLELQTEYSNDASVRHHPGKLLSAASGTKGKKPDRQSDRRKITLST